MHRQINKFRIIRTFPHYHRDCSWIPERGYKTMLVKTVCLGKLVRGEREGEPMRHRRDIVKIVHVRLCAHN